MYKSKLLLPYILLSTILGVQTLSAQNMQTTEGQIYRADNKQEFL